MKILKNLDISQLKVYGTCLYDIFSLTIVLFCRKLGDGLFLESCRKVACLYPDIEFNDMIIDNASMQVLLLLHFIIVLVCYCGLDVRILRFSLHYFSFRLITFDYCFDFEDTSASFE